jgi:glycerol kinase
MRHYLLAIDQGTTNSHAIIFDKSGMLVSQHELALKLYYPSNGWVEQDPEEMFNNTIICCRESLKKVNISPKAIAAIGISNQRETTIIWDKQTGKPIYPAIVWQDRRTSEMCLQLAEHPISSQLQDKTGLLLDPYFSATKIKWILENIPDAFNRATRGELLFGTVDTFLLWKLTHGKSHLTDATNASRTLLFNIRTQEWDKDILAALNIPFNLLPKVCDNTANFGEIDKSILGETIPITGMAGDQQAATIGQACFHTGMVKATFGTGGFLLLNTGSHIIQSRHQLLSTIAYRINNEVTYGLEGSFFCAGVTIKWLRDSLKLITTAAESETLPASIVDTGGVYLIPAFTGLGAPYWNPLARGAIVGLTRDSSKEHIVRAALESVAYQSLDLLNAMMSDSQEKLTTLRVDGGMAANNWLLQFLSDMLNSEIERPVCIETSALGAAYLAGLQVGMYQSLEEISELWQQNIKFMPRMSLPVRKGLYEGWQHALQRVL